MDCRYINLIMLKDVFRTQIAQGKFEISNDFTKLFNKWIEIEKLLDAQGVENSTTNRGWQKTFLSDEKLPDWFKFIEADIQKVKDLLSCTKIQSSWIVDYDIGGYQDLHMHVRNGSNWTVIFNIAGKGEILIHDPRPVYVAHSSIYIEEITLDAGSWIAMPSWLVHSSRPCLSKRSIFVMDVK